MLDWVKLLTGERQRRSESGSYPHRNEFDKDYERIIYSSSLRRLQDKAQVFPLQKNDFIRTRLTHSLEVASLGRSMAWNIGHWLMKRDIFKGFHKAKEFASLVEVSCLVHDLGNPPFGHYGEDIIRRWFQNWFSSDYYKEEILKRFDDLNTQQKNDFQYFEGNAQTLRILSKLQFLNDQYGANFTYSTLATLMKYPWNSSDSRAFFDDKVKYSYFYSENELVNEISNKLKLNGVRHPATYILEAADDIAYLTADIEDAIKKKAFDWDDVYSEFKSKFYETYSSKFDRLERLRKQAIENEVPDRNLINVQNFKVVVQGIMILAVVDTFKENYSSIINGEFKNDLLSNSSASNLAKELGKVAKKYVYSNKEVLTLELVGDRVISDLLDLFVNAVVNVEEVKKTKTKHQKLVNLISENFRHIQRISENGEPTVEFENLTLYNRLQLVTDFISGMTDGYAVNLHQELLGVKLP